MFVSIFLAYAIFVVACVVFVVIAKIIYNKNNKPKNPPS